MDIPDRQRRELKRLAIEWICATGVIIIIGSIAGWNDHRVGVAMATSFTLLFLWLVPRSQRRLVPDDAEVARFESLLTSLSARTRSVDESQIHLDVVIDDRPFTADITAETRTGFRVHLAERESESAVLEGPDPVSATAWLTNTDFEEIDTATWFEVERSHTGRWRVESNGRDILNRELRRLISSTLKRAPVDSVCYEGSWSLGLGLATEGELEARLIAGAALIKKLEAAFTDVA